MNRELLIHLIQEELRNKYLMQSLENLGFDCSPYYLNISSEIIELAGVKEKTDEFYQWYNELLYNAVDGITFMNFDELLEILSLDIYTQLEKEVLLKEKPKL